MQTILCFGQARIQGGPWDLDPSPPQKILATVHGFEIDKILKKITDINRLLPTEKIKMYVIEIVTVFF